MKETLYNHSSILFATEMLHHVPLFQVAKVYSFLNILPNKYYTDKTLLVFNGQTGGDRWRSRVWGDLLGSILCSLKRPCPLQPVSHMFLLKTLTMCICNSFYIESYDHMNYTNTEHCNALSDPFSKNLAFRILNDHQCTMPQKGHFNPILI